MFLNRSSEIFCRVQVCLCCRYCTIGCRCVCGRSSISIYICISVSILHLTNSLSPALFQIHTQHVSTSVNLIIISSDIFLLYYVNGRKGHSFGTPNGDCHHLNIFCTANYGFLVFILPCVLGPAPGGPVTDSKNSHNPCLPTATHWSLCATHSYTLESLCYTQLHTGVSVLHTATHWSLCATHSYTLESLCYTQLHTGVSVLHTATHWSLCATHSYTLESLCYTQLHTGVSVLHTAIHWSLCAT
ncbi:hypothetical protein ANANG_G00112720, partial [Anguilla anguilla]